MSALSAALLMYALAIGVALLVAVVIKAIVTATGLFARTPTAAAPVEATAAIPPHHLIIIAAAAQAMLGSAQRIVHIEDAGRGRAWTSSTRAAHYASHMPRHRH